MTSADLRNLTNLIYNQKFQVYSSNIKINFIDNKAKSILVRIILKKNDEKIEIESNEEDVEFFISSFRNTLDKNGNFNLIKYKDLNKYYHELNFLLDINKEKINNACKNFLNGKDRLKYNPDKLLEDFFNSSRRSSKKYEKLKQDYFEIFAYYLFLSKTYLKIEKELNSKNKKYKEYCDLIDIILSQVFRRDRNFIKNYLNYSKNIHLNLDYLADRAKEQSDFIKQLFGILKEKRIINGKFGIMQILDIYRRFSDLSSHFINALRITIELIEGADNPEPTKRYVENCKIIRSNNQYSKIVESLDPRIRHSESHINTKVDEKSGKVILTQIKNGNEINIDEYSFEEVIKMTKNLERSVFPALLSSFYLQKIALINSILISKEYKILLLGIGNIS